MQFIHQPLTWGFFLVLLPLLIHLINLMRQRRVEWAAMEFLQQAYKKRRNWIWLKQFLLLLARMLAIAAAVAMLAKLVTREQWSSFFGGKSTHHYVLLDDSLSMGERLGGGTAFDRAVSVVGQLLAQISADGAPVLPKGSGKTMEARLWIFLLKWFSTMPRTRRRALAKNRWKFFVSRSVSPDRWITQPSSWIPTDSPAP